MKSFSRLHGAHSGGGAGHDDVKVFNHQKLTQFIEYHVGRVKHQAYVPFLSQRIVNVEFQSELREILWRRDKLAEQRRSGKRFAALPGQASRL